MVSHSQGTSFYKQSYAFPPIGCLLCPFVTLSTLCDHRYKEVKTGSSSCLQKWLSYLDTQTLLNLKPWQLLIIPQVCWAVVGGLCVMACVSLYVRSEVKLGYHSLVLRPWICVAFVFLNLDYIIKIAFSVLSIFLQISFFFPFQHVYVPHFHFQFISWYMSRLIWCLAVMKRTALAVVIKRFW